MRERNGSVIACKACGAERYCHPSAFKFSKPQFCGSACWYAFAKGKSLTRPSGRLSVDCKQCRQPFSIHKSARRKFCGEVCMYAWRKQNPSPKRVQKIDC